MKIWKVIFNLGGLRLKGYYFKLGIDSMQLKNIYNQGFIFSNSLNRCIGEDP
jgi:hypothetical protein